MHQLKLKTRLFLAYVGLTVLILLTFSIFFYRYVSKQLIKQEINSISSLNSNFQDQVESVIRDMDSVSININYSSLVKDKLDSSFNLDISRNTLSSLASLFVTINGVDNKVDQIYLYDMKGHVLQVGIKTNTQKTNISNLTWFKPVLSLNGKKLISDPYNSLSLSTTIKSYEWLISLYRTYNNQYGRTVGTVETVKKCKGVFKSIISYQKKNSDSTKVYVYSKDNHLIYPYNLTDKEKKQIPSYISHINKSADALSIINPYTKAKEYFAYEKSNYTGWTYITIKPESYILKPVNQLLGILLLFVFALLAASLIISYWISGSLVKPVKHLKHIVQRLEIDTLGTDDGYLYPTGYNELYELYHAFQHMSENLKKSMNELIDSRQQELKSRTLALQSQINPHFYYNTLSSIIVLAENGQPKEVITMCRYLSQMMRYITDTKSTVITVQLEMDYVNKYLYCMKIRYQTSLNYTLDIDERLLDQQIPKLLIQPVVENAIKYGTNCNPPWNIYIIGKIYDSYWQIDIIDSGNGFSDQDIELINQHIKAVDENPGMPDMNIDGLGMLNVYMRWKLHCGNSIIFHFGNTEDGHGIVSIGQKITLPKEEEQ
jgi:Predicted signal transduction protein with a C-terminal ATPase domain